MGLIVTETGGNFSTATWYRAEAWQLDMSVAPSSLGTTRLATVTFANAGNIRGAILSLGNSSTAFPVPVGRSAYLALQRGRTATLPTASPGIVTLTGHGFTGAASGVTITIEVSATVTLNAHGLVDGDVVGFSTTGALPTGIASTSSYYVINATTNTFKIAASRDGVAIDTSGSQSGTHSLWRETVQFTTSGTLPTGVTANTVYFVDYIGVNTFYLRPSPTGSRVNFTGSPSGTHTCWDPRDYASIAQDDIYGSLTYASFTLWFLPVMFKRQTAVTTAASGWRFSLAQYNGSGTNIATSCGVGGAPFLIAWCNNTVSYTTSDAPVFCAKTTIDQNVTFKGTVAFTPYASSAITVGLAGLVCSPPKTARAYSSSGSGNCMLTVNSSAPRTLTVDGAVITGSQGGIYFGTEDSPISYANKLTVNCVTPTIAGGTATLSGFGDTTYGYSNVGTGSTLVVSGAYPAVKYATLTGTASVGQAVLNVDDGTPFQVNDYVYVTNNNAMGTGTATRHQILSVVGNVITLTANLSGEDRLIGGRVVLLERGYGVQFYRDVLNSNAAGYRFSNPSNLYIQGLYARGIAGLFGTATGRFYDDTGNKRSGGLFICNNLFDSYQGAQLTSTTTFLAVINPETDGALLQHNMVMNAPLMGLAFEYISSPTAGLVVKGGNVSILDNFISRNVSAVFLPSISTSASMRLTVKRNVFQNCASGISVSGNNGEFSDNIFKNTISPIAFSTVNTFCSASYNVYDSCQYIYALPTVGSILLKFTENYPTLLNGTPTSFVHQFASETYYDVTVFSPKGNMSGFDFTNQSFIADNSLFRIISNNDTGGSDIVVSPNDVSYSWTSAINLPVATLDTPGVVVTSFDNTTIEFKTEGSYNLTQGAHIGTLTFRNISAGVVVVLLSPGVSYVNEGPDLAVNLYHSFSVTAPNIPIGASVRLINRSKDIELDLVTGLSTLPYSKSLEAYSGYDIEFGDLIEINAFRAVGAIYSNYYKSLFPAPSAGNVTIVDAWTLWSNANALNVDGSNVEDFQTDYTNIQLDIKDGTLTWWGAEAVAFALYKTMEAEGMRKFFGKLSSRDPAHWYFNGDVQPLQLDNLSAQSATQTDTVIIARDDGQPVVVSPTTGGGGISLLFSNDVTSVLQGMLLRLTSDYDAAKTAASASSLASLASTAATATALSSLASAVSSIPTNPLLTNDSRLNHLDEDISSASGGFSSTDRNALNSAKGNTDTLLTNVAAIPTAPSFTSTDRSNLGAVKTRTDLIPDHPASQEDLSSVALSSEEHAALMGGFGSSDRSLLTSAKNNTDTIITTVNSIHSKTDNIPASPATQSSINTLQSSVSGISTQISNLGFTSRISMTIPNDIQRPSVETPLHGLIYLKHTDGTKEDPYLNQFAVRILDATGTRIDEGMLYSDEEFTTQLSNGSSILNSGALAIRDSLGQFHVYMKLSHDLSLGNFFIVMDWFDDEPTEGQQPNTEIKPINIVDYSTLDAVKSDIEGLITAVAAIPTEPAGLKTDERSALLSLPDSVDSLSGKVDEIPVPPTIEEIDYIVVRDIGLLVS